MASAVSWNAIDVPIRRARADEAARLSELALRAKGQWGYDAEFLAACRPLLTLSGEYVAVHPIFLVERDGLVAGFYGLEVPAATTLPPTAEAELAYLFVEPAAMGRGAGRTLPLFRYDLDRRAP